MQWYMYCCEKIARKLHGLGHRRTVEECHRQIKRLRRDYRKVIAHNRQSGNDPISCPFFTQLHCILLDDTSIAPPWLVRSTPTLPVSPMPPTPLPDILQCSLLEPLPSEDPETINITDPRGTHCSRIPRS